MRTVVASVYQIGGSLGPTGTNAILGDPAQLTGSADQLYLSAGSPALAAGSGGIGVDADFFGLSRDGTPDLGHHETSAAGSPPANPPLPPLPPDRSGYATLPLAAACTAFPETVIAGSAVNLDAAGSKGSIVEYIWNFGDGHVYSGSDGFIAYDWIAPGIYTVTLTNLNYFSS